MDITQIAGLLSGAAGVVGVDTGLSHLAAALDVPGVTLYLATDPRLTGAWGRRQTCLVSRAPHKSERESEECGLKGPNIVGIETLSAENVWKFLTTKTQVLEGRNSTGLINC